MDKILKHGLKAQQSCTDLIDTARDLEDGTNEANDEHELQNIVHLANQAIEGLKLARDEALKQLDDLDSKVVDYEG